MPAALRRRTSLPASFVVALAKGSALAERSAQGVPVQPASKGWIKRLTRWQTPLSLNALPERPLGSLSGCLLLLTLLMSFGLCLLSCFLWSHHLLSQKREQGKPSGTAPHESNVLSSDRLTLREPGLKVCVVAEVQRHGGADDLQVAIGKRRRKSKEAQVVCNVAQKEPPSVEAALTAWEKRNRPNGAEARQMPVRLREEHPVVGFHGLLPAHLHRVEEKSVLSAAALIHLNRRVRDAPLKNRESPVRENRREDAVGRQRQPTGHKERAVAYKLCTVIKFNEAQPLLGIFHIFTTAGTMIRLSHG